MSNEAVTWQIYVLNAERRRDLSTEMLNVSGPKGGRIAACRLRLF